MTGQRLKLIREGFGLTQEAFAELLGYTAKAIQNYEHERQPITKALENHVLALVRLDEVKKIVKNNST